MTTSLQTTTIDYTDGTLALTIGSNGAITSSTDATVTGDLTVSGNDIKDNGGSAAITFDGSSNITTGGPFDWRSDYFCWRGNSFICQCICTWICF